MSLDQILYPAIEPYASGMVDVGNGHTVYYERVGTPGAKPAVFLHGGPGGGSEPIYRRFFNPEQYDVLLFDQRGCGKSTPFAELEHNTTQHLIADIELLREKCGIEQWQVFGGSWGSTLALAYAQAYPQRVTELVLRGIFMCRRFELEWFYQEGASHIFPDIFEEYRNFIPETERGDLMAAYYKRLTGSDKQLQLNAARMWTYWEKATSRLLLDEKLSSKSEKPEFALPFARIECHYFNNGAFMEEGQLLRDAHKIIHIPTVIIQGRYDVVCPPISAWQLHNALPQSELVMVPDAGHSCLEPGIAQALVAATNAYAGQKSRAA